MLNSIHTHQSSHDKDQAMLIRAKTHIHIGRQRLRNGKISLGIVTLYDALTSAMQWYITSPENKIKSSLISNDNLNDDGIVFNVLVRSGVIDREFNYDALNELMDMALKRDMSSYDYSDILRQIEFVMTQLGVMPFDENELPPEI